MRSSLRADKIRLTHLPSYPRYCALTAVRRYSIDQPRTATKPFGLIQQAPFRLHFHNFRPNNDVCDAPGNHPRHCHLGRRHPRGPPPPFEQCPCLVDSLPWAMGLSNSFAHSLFADSRRRYGWNGAPPRKCRFGWARAHRFRLRRRS